MKLKLATYWFNKPAAVLNNTAFGNHTTRDGLKRRELDHKYLEFIIQRPASSIQHPASRIQNPKSGFTLLEVLIALAIMAVVLAAVYRMQSQTLSMTTANRFYTIAPMLAQGKMAQLETASDDIIAEDSGDFGEKFPGYSWSVATAEVSSEALGEVGKDLKQIEVTVALNENEYVYSIRTYRLMRN
jgi:general secretion pathway protein I